MKTTRHGDYLIKLTRFLGLISCFLVREDDGLTLIDTNLPGSTNDILAAAGAAGLPITRILLTHAHMDHVASLDALRAALPTAEVGIGEREARLLAGDKSLDAGEPGETLRGSYHVCQTKPTLLLQPGQQVGSLQAVAAPGHTPGQMAYLDTRDNTLIVGDAFQTQGGIAVSGVIRPLFPFPALATWHKPTALQTARALRALEPARLAAGHGPVLEAPLAAMDEAIAIAERRFS
jgi:glyoxylase-like metal-dependent hydrolase (beta-lactamase superfamily II)